MDRDNEALRRRMTGTAGDPAESEESAEDETYVVREGVTRAIDPDEIELRRDRAVVEDDSSARVHADIASFDPDRELARPPDFPESLDVATVAPDGTTVPDRTSQLTDPLTGEAIGGSGLSGPFKNALGGRGSRGVESFLDPLTDSAGITSPSDRDIERAVGQHDGSHVSTEPPNPVGQATLDVLATAADQATSPNPVGQATLDVLATAADQATSPNPVGQATLDVLATATDQKQPDPMGSDDIITGESIAAAIKTNDPGIFDPPPEDSGATEGIATSLAWAGAENDPRLTNYGPEGPQNVEVADNWAQPTDGIFDPPAEGASAGMVGAESAMADPAAALGGSAIGSSTPDDFPPPPDPPPGDNPDDGPPDGGGGGEG